MWDVLRQHWQDRHLRHKALLSMLLPWLAATEFIENSSFLFSAGHVAQGLQMGAAGLACVLAAFATGSMVMVALQQLWVRHIGYRRYLLLSLALFQLGALASLWAGGIGVLMITRALQGLGAGALFTSGRILVPLLFAPADRAPALRRFIRWLFGLSALGPALAAGVIHVWGWRAVFAVPLPLSLLCSLIVWAALPEGVGRQAQPAWGQRVGAVVALVVVIALLQWGLAEARFPQQISLHRLLWPLALALLVLLGWWWHQRDHQAPLLHWRGLRHPGYLAGLGLYGLYYLIANANGLVLPVFAERVMGLPIGVVGLLGSAGALVSWLAAQAYLHWGARSTRKPMLMAAAAALMALVCLSLASLVGLAGLASASGLPLLPVFVAAVATKGVFGSLFVLPLAGLTFRELGDEHFGPGYQLKNLLRHLMISVGMALAAWGLAPGTAGSVSSVGPAGLAQACTHVFVALGLACGVLMAWVALQRTLR